MIDRKNFEAIAAAVRRDLLPVVHHAVAAGLMPHVVRVHRSRSGVAVVVKLRDGVHVEREVRLDPMAVDLRIRLDLVEQAIGSIVDAAVRRSAAGQRAPLGRRP